MKTIYPINEHQHTINNVPGRMYTIHGPQSVRGNMVHRNQTWIATRPIAGYGAGGQITVKIRFDDGCQNGHQSFSVTADVVTNESRRQRDIAAGGCLHEDIAQVFPELAPLIKWHFMRTDGPDGPMHYIANTVYHASDRDHNGLLKGEVRQLRNGKTGLLCWKLEATGNLPQYVDSDTQPTETTTLHYVPWTRTGEGKARDLDAARLCAIWPEATDEELSADKETLTAALTARLPGLIAEFRADMERVGFLWEPETEGGTKA
ncbi:MAG: hypothetical protein A2Y38_12105 [Spirochaetes bacterium GWB1_59_5]|nr:MAG: hypothetical protein A2Y38_12105 [Spirochaetes bacterium GWB1_59_5]